MPHDLLSSSPFPWEPFAALGTATVLRRFIRHGPKQQIATLSALQSAINQKVAPASKWSGFNTTLVNAQLQIFPVGWTEPFWTVEHTKEGFMLNWPGTDHRFGPMSWPCRDIPSLISIMETYIPQPA